MACSNEPHLGMRTSSVLQHFWGCQGALVETWPPKQCVTQEQKVPHLCPQEQAQGLSPRLMFSQMVLKRLERFRSLPAMALTSWQAREWGPVTAGPPGAQFPGAFSHQQVAASSGLYPGDMRAPKLQLLLHYTAK